MAEDAGPLSGRMRMSARAQQSAAFSWNGAAEARLCSGLRECATRRRVAEELRFVAGAAVSAARVLPCRASGYLRWPGGGLAVAVCV